MRCPTRSKRLVAILVFGGLALSQDKRSVWDGVYTAEQAKRGQARYNQQCASCHGDTLMGGESAPPLAGGEFLSTWNGLTAGELFDRLGKGLAAVFHQEADRRAVGAAAEAVVELLAGAYRERRGLFAMERTARLVVGAGLLEWDATVDDVDDVDAAQQRRDEFVGNHRLGARAEASRTAGF